MNTRIQQLESQCWSTHIDGTLIDGQVHFDTNKFAHLIIHECAEIARLNTREGSKVNQMIVEHFTTDQSNNPKYYMTVEKTNEKSGNTKNY